MFRNRVLAHRKKKYYAYLKYYSQVNSIAREGNDTPLWYSCLENPMDGGAWQAAVHGITKSRTRLNDFTFTFHFHALERKWQPTPLFLPGESHGWRSLGGCRLWCRTESDMTEVTQQQQQQHCLQKSNLVSMSSESRSQKTTQHINSIFYPKCYEKLLESSKQGSETTC